jgi:acetyl esterase/lipase
VTRGHRFGKRPGTVGIQRRKTRKASCRIEDLPALVVGAQRPTTSPSATSATTQAAPRIARTATPSRDCAPARSDTTRALASASAEAGDERTARLVASKATRQPVEIVQAILTAHDNGDPLNRVAANVQATGVHFLSVDYRLAPEYLGTTLVDDGHAALAWFVEQADTFGLDKARIAIMGDSGGGGVTAGVAIAARNARTPVAQQILIYPMLDDRTIERTPRSSHS